MKIIGIYKITYSCGTVQEKNLIRHYDYVTIIKPRQDLIYKLELKKNKHAASKIKNELLEMFGAEWFTLQSPLAYASITGILDLPDNQGGAKPLKVELMPYKSCKTIEKEQ